MSVAWKEGNSLTTALQGFSTTLNQRGGSAVYEN